MDDLIKNKKTIFICLCLIGIVLLSLYFDNYFKKNKVDTISESINMEIKQYDANQYIPVNMKEEDVIKKYLNDYKNLMLYDVEAAYYTLNKEYRDLKYENIDEYKEYVNTLKSLSLFSLSVDKYLVKYIDGYKFFDIEGTDGNRYIIKEISIMNYEVFLDSYTVNIR